METVEQISDMPQEFIDEVEEHFLVPVASILSILNHLWVIALPVIGQSTVDLDKTNALMASSGGGDDHGGHH